MTLDLVIMRPEFFLLFGFQVQLWYGTGGLVRPVAEIITVADSNYNKQYSCLGSFQTTTITTEVEWNGKSKAISQQGRKSSDFGNFRNPTAGPNHAASALCLWAILWCLLCTLLSVLWSFAKCFFGRIFSKRCLIVCNCVEFCF